MSVGATRAHLRGDPNCLHDFVRRCAMAHRSLGVAAYAIRTLSNVRHCDGNQLLSLNCQGAVGEHALAESCESVMNVWRKLLARRRELGGGMGEDVSRHDAFSSGSRSCE